MPAAGRARRRAQRRRPRHLRRRTGDRPLAHETARSRPRGNRIARAEGGATWGELDAATQVHGLATPGGVFSDTGIAGLTLGGGFGWLRSKYGLSATTWSAPRLVTAARQVIRASATENADLLWALRGGGGNFGVVTTFEYSLHPLGPEVFMAFAFHDGEGDTMKRGRPALSRLLAPTAPDEVSTLIAAGRSRPSTSSRPTFTAAALRALRRLYAGPSNDGQRCAAAPARLRRRRCSTTAASMPYVDAQKMFDDDYPNGRATTGSRST